MRTGDVILYRTRPGLFRPMSWLAWAIRAFTKVKYNHVAVIVNNWEVPFINEAVGKGVVARPAENHLERKNAEYLVLRPTFSFNEREFAVRANNALGKKYDYVNLIFQQVHYRLFRWWLGRDKKKEETSMVCSEYAAYCFDPFEKGFDEWWKWSAKEFLESSCFEKL